LRSVELKKRGVDGCYFIYEGSTEVMNTDGLRNLRAFIDKCIRYDDFWNERIKYYESSYFDLSSDTNLYYIENYSQLYNNEVSNEAVYDLLLTDIINAKIADQVTIELEPDKKHIFIKCHTLKAAILFYNFNYKHYIAPQLKKIKENNNEFRSFR
jgi:hypothetical protein